MKNTYFNRYEDIAWPPQCYNFGSIAGVRGFKAGSAVPAVNMLEDAMVLHLYSLSKSAHIIYIFTFWVLKLASPSCSD